MVKRDILRFHVRLLLVVGALGLGAGAAAVVFRAPLRAWAYSVTGEEGLAQQIKGVAYYAGNLVRPQPRLAAAGQAGAQGQAGASGQADPASKAGTIQYADVNPLGINTFLQQEVEPAKRERSLQMIRDAGFRWIRQEFPWEDIEIHGKGDFEDRRWEPYRSAWEKYDNIVDLAGKYDIQIIARLSTPPKWARAENNEFSSLWPPDDVADFGDFVYAVVDRYKGRIRYYQIWNEPNLVREWGVVDAAEYVDLLKVAYTRAKEADPNCVILSGALSATIELDREEWGKGVSDFVYLQQMYDAGAAPYFDIMSVQGYGLFSGPTNRRMQARVLNFSRPEYIRDIMVANGDAATPIWISELDWSPVPEGIPPVYGRYDEVTRARYVVEAYQRIEREWPWMGVACFWFFKRADDSERAQPEYYFRMVEPDFTPLPVYDAVKAYASARDGEGG